MGRTTTPIGTVRKVAKKKRELLAKKTTHKNHEHHRPRQGKEKRDGLVDLGTSGEKGHTNSPEDKKNKHVLLLTKQHKSQTKTVITLRDGKKKVEKSP